MSSWPKVELEQIAETDDLQISPVRKDGVTYGTPTDLVGGRRQRAVGASL
jgi:hypothetical protein